MKTYVLFVLVNFRYLIHLYVMVALWLLFGKLIIYYVLWKVYTVLYHKHDYFVQALYHEIHLVLFLCLRALSVVFVVLVNFLVEFLLQIL